MLPAKPTIHDILAALRGSHGKIAILCGAGISAASGIPTVSLLLQNILEVLDIDVDDVDDLRLSSGAWSMPFEAFMELFIEHDQNTRLFDVFALGAPNANHGFIRHLAQSRILARLYTTNFDLLIEQSLDAQTKVPYRVITEQMGLDALDTASLPIVKLHGTVGDKATIRSTIHSISSGQGYSVRKRLVRRLVESEPEILLVWGYSCSDVLDISPAVAEVQLPRKTVLLLQHDPAICLSQAVVSPLAACTPSEHPFHGFGGCGIRVDADALIAVMFGTQPPVRETPGPSHAWEQIVRDWAESFAFPSIKQSIMCHVFYNVGKYELALKYNTRALDANSPEDIRGKGAALSNRGMILYKLGQREPAVKAFEAAMGIFRSLEFAFGIATSYNNIGNVTGHLGKLEEGQAQLQLGLDYLDEHSFREELMCRGHLRRSQGELHVLNGNAAEAHRCYDFALEAFSQGYVPEQAEVLVFKGKLYKQEGRVAEARASLSRAVTIAKQVGVAEVLKDAETLLAKL